MRILSLLILYVLLFSSNRLTDPPHGPDFKISCITCHSSGGWQIDKAIYSFDHSKTKLPLLGQHKEINCRQCHPSLIFSEAKALCNQCHLDVHQSTTGSDCSRCHTSFSWLVNNINEIHLLSRFPLLGVHRTVDCTQCHRSESLVRFDVPGVNCIDCHRSSYLATTNPDHIQSGFSEDCAGCHPVNSFQWTGTGFSHSFFPLVHGHALPKCVDCHTSSSIRYSGLNRDCNSCHQKDYLEAANPDHTNSGFPTSCETCHTLNIGWKPAGYRQHDSKFPISSGAHSGFTCGECHENPADYTLFACINCHEHNKTDMDRKHREEGGNYSYNSTECFRCHPGGKAD